MTHSTKGIVHGNTIELRDAIDLPDGAEVFVTGECEAPRAVKKLTPDESIRRAAGSWSDDPAGLDAYLESNRKSRQPRPDSNS